MQISNTDILSLFRQEDIEGLIAAGAPADEYDGEATMLADAIAELEETECTTENIFTIISLLWMKSFNLGEEDLLLRLPALQGIASRIVASSPAS